MVHVVNLINLDSYIYLFKHALIKVLSFISIFMTVSNKYANFIDDFLMDMVTQISKYMGINNHIIKLINNEQSHSKNIYGIRLME